MKKLVITAAVLCAVTSAITLTALGAASPGTSANSAIVTSDSEVLYEKNADEARPMASTTKIMTCIIALEMCDPDEIVTVTYPSSIIEGTSLYLKEGDTISVRDLIYASMLRSANDAASSLARHISWSEAEFTYLMNEKAASLGMTSTHFDNPHGLPSDAHYSTARDMAKLAEYAMNNEEFRKIASTKKYTVTVSGKGRILINHNKLLSAYPGADGVKTGYTKEAGRCLVSSAERDGVRLVCVTLSDPDDWRDHKALLDYGFSIRGIVWKK